MPSVSGVTRNPQPPCKAFSLRRRLPRWHPVLVSPRASAPQRRPFWRFGDPVRWLAYLLAGTTVDLACLSSQQWRRRLWILIPLGRLAHATKPVLRAWITGAAGWPYESLLGGLAYPTWSHAAFGMLGAAAGVALLASRARRGQETSRHYDVSGVLVDRDGFPVGRHHFGRHYASP